MITFDTIGVNNPIESEELIKNWILKIIHDKNFEVGDISYNFCDDDKILEVNKEYLNHDYFTDVITFDASAGNVISCEVVISVDTVLSNAEKYEVSFEEELHRVIAHAILHLIGYNDKNDEDQKEMTEQENKALNLLKRMKNEA